MKYFFNFLIVALFSITINAQYPIDGAYQSIPVPTTPALPNHGQSVIDNSVPSPIEITRITEIYNYVDGNGDPQVWYPTHEYAKTQVWNADQSKYKIASWKVYDATNLQELQSLSSMYPSYWSNTDPDLMWSFRENGDIKKYTVSTNTTQTVATISKPSGGAYDFLKLGPGEGNIDKNDHYVAFAAKDGLDMDVVIFDLQTLQVIFTKKFVGAWQNGGGSFPNYVDWVSVSQSGNYVVIMWNHNTTSQANPYLENGNSHYGVEVYNTTDMMYQNRIMSYGNHGDLGYAVDGDEVLVQFYGWYGNGTLYMHKLDGSGSTNLTTNTDFGVAGHASCRNINRPGWAYVTHSLAAQSGQIVAVKLDNSGTVEHYGHHFSSGTSYDQAAMAVASPNGDIICFKSDFGTGPNTTPSVVYSFFASLVTDSYDTISATDCNSYVSPSGNYTWTTSGAYHDTLTNALGYDSLLTINLTINSSSTGIDTKTACDSYTWIDGNTYTSSNNTATYTLTNSAGCDSVISLNLTIENVNTNVIINSQSLSADLFGANYQWLDCDANFSIINGAINQTFTPLNNGNYAVEITSNTCTDTSICYAINDLGLTKLIDATISITPNPANDFIKINSKNPIDNITIYNESGQVIKVIEPNKSTNTLVNTKDLNQGVYFIRIQTQNESILKKIIKID